MFGMESDVRCFVAVSLLRRGYFLFESQLSNDGAGEGYLLVRSFPFEVSTKNTQWKKQPDRV